jgi:hypothetical protein
MNDLDANGVEPPVSSCYVQQRPRMLYQSHFRGECVLMNKRGRRRMLLVLLLPWQVFGNIRNRSIGPLVSVISKAHARFTSNPRTSFGQECRLRLKQPPPIRRPPDGALHLNPRPSGHSRTHLLLRPLSVGRFALLRFRPKNMAHHIFQLESELQNIPQAAPEASRSFSVSEKLARYGSSALSGVEHLTLLVGKKSVALALTLGAPPIAVDGRNEPEFVADRKSSTSTKHDNEHDFGGAGEGNRTPVLSLGSSRSTIELHPHRIAPETPRIKVTVNRLDRKR